MKLFGFWLALVVLILGSEAFKIVNKQDEKDREKDSYHPSHVTSAEKDFDNVPEEERTSEFWNNGAQTTLKEKLSKRKQPIAQRPKNVIFFIGDGLSPQTIAATRMYLGNENEALSFEKFPYLGQAKTYCVNRQVPDSACTGTAYLSGVKINYAMLNVAASIPRSTCEYQKSNETEIYGIMKWAQEAGKATGIVTNTRVTHASPAAAYAQSASRSWESDANVVASRCDPSRTIDIARQLVENDVPSKFKVILGGGRREFRPNGYLDEENYAARRLDGRDLIKEWVGKHEALGETRYVWNRTELMDVDASKTEYLMGLFEGSHMRFNVQNQAGNRPELEPTLEDMTQKAIEMLQKYDDGYVLFIEGGQIDLAHHATYARISLDETAEYSKAIAKARSMTSEEDTLIVVSADHSHTMMYNGYPDRGQDVLGIAGISSQDRLPYTTLSYANGPGWANTYTPENRAIRQDISDFNFNSISLQYPATVPLDSETHGAEDVNVYASGPYSHIFVGNYEQSALPHLMAYASGIGAYLERDDDNTTISDTDFIIENSAFDIESARFRIHNSRFRIHNSQFRINDSVFKIRDADFEIQ
ncbi:membrane-bound alkaline phosphatase-like [Uranotaenia lowii]|uniref:membrane-bound alkaline phosphatase-like n=1 Tax=Uranotaenia lowii TaxID=190385 RepID=UPI00247AFC3E|nr:membrane-bound alkaline phosphatase-like [Uranotaenia lowii]